jgi:signal transduction histidine kinase/CheY-like chemotaxis protein/HPt (histidine-containing phosphotransfer) domain-containing protein/PAS domain-containing protein
MTTSYVSLLACAALVALAIAWSSWRQRALPSALALVWLSLAVAEWTATCALELSASDFASKLVWAKLQYAGIVCVPVAWLVLTARVAGELVPVVPVRGGRSAAVPHLKYSHVAAFMMPQAARLGESYAPADSEWLAGLAWVGRHLALLAIPLLTLTLALTNDLHHLLWSSVDPLASVRLRELSVSYGPWFWVHAAFSYLLLLIGSIQLVQIIGAAPGICRRQVIMLLFSAFVPWAGNALYLARIAPFYPLDPTPVAFAISVLLLGWALLGFRFLQIVPFIHGAIIEHLHDGVLVLDPWQRVVAMNPAAELIVGTSAGTALGQPIGRVLAAYPELLELSSAAVEARIEISIGQPASQRHYDVHCAPLSDWRGQIGGQMIMLQDVTQRKRSEDVHRFLANASTLLASSLDYETTLATVARLVVPFLADWCMVYLRGADQTVHYATTVAADSAKQVLADDLRLGDSHVPPSYLRLPRTGQSQLIAEVSDADMVDLATDTRQLAILRAIGLRSMISVPLIARGRLLGTLLLAAVESGRSYGAHDLVLAEDLAGRMALAVDNARLFEELHAADRAKSELLAHMSHEIRTPISGVLGMTDLLLETDLAAEQRDFIETIRIGGKALLAVVNSVLDFSKIEAGRLELEQAPFDVQACVEEAIGMVAIMAADKQLDLACVFDPATPARLIGDMTRLRQVLVNLLSNAIKFTHQGDVFVSVAAHALDDAHYQLRFSVADTGIGIPADRMQDIFTPFSQFGATTYRRYGGTGLGLAISRRLVALMGGQIWVESQIGAGSTFSFTLTVIADPDAAVVAQTAHPLLAGKRLLIVDERRRSQQALVAYAEARGMLPFPTVSALEALTWIRQGQRFDVAIVDVLNSEMHGLTLASEIRRYHDAHALPLILVHTLGRHSVSPREAEGDYQVLLHKPLRLFQLQAALINIFEGRAFHANPPVKRSSGAAWPANEQVPCILLAEDDAINQQVILHMLQKLGYQIEVVRDGDLALAAIEQRYYDVVLLDMQMPSKDGLEVARAIRQRFPADRQPYLVAITANVMEGAREECLSAGMDDYISKPVLVAELMQVIEMHRLRARPASAEAPAAFQLDRLPEQGAGASSTGAVLETSQPLHHLLGGDTTWQLADLIARFLDDTTDLLNVMSSAATLGDMRTIQRAAHRLKSSSALLTATMLSELCDQLEHALRTNAPIDVREHVERITIEFARVKAALSA